MHLNSILENKLVSGCVQSSRGDRLVYYAVTGHSQGLA